MAPKVDPCKKEACAIQTCLQANNYQESRCQAYIDALYKCCEKYGPEESIVCEGIHTKHPGKSLSGKGKSLSGKGKSLSGKSSSSSSSSSSL